MKVINVTNPDVLAGVINAEMTGGCREAAVDLLRISGRQKNLSETDLQVMG